MPACRRSRPLFRVRTLVSSSTRHRRVHHDRESRERSPEPRAGTRPCGRTPRQLMRRGCRRTRQKITSASPAGNRREGQRRPVVFADGHGRLVSMHVHGLPEGAVVHTPAPRGHRWAGQASESLATLFAPLPNCTVARSEGSDLRFPQGQMGYVVNMKSDSLLSAGFFRKTCTNPSRSSTFSLTRGMFLTFSW